MTGYILLVEDNPDDVEITRFDLRHSSLTEPVVVARDGAEALEAIFGREGPPSEGLPVLVLLDVRLPKVNGLEVLRRIRNDPRTCRLPVVLRTGTDPLEELPDVEGDPATAFASKDVGAAGLSRAVKSLGYPRVPV